MSIRGNLGFKTLTGEACDQTMQRAYNQLYAPELTCDSGQVLNSGGLSSSCLPHQKNRLPFGYTHRQLFQQNSRGTSGSKCLVVPVYIN